MNSLDMDKTDTILDNVKAKCSLVRICFGGKLCLLVSFGNACWVGEPLIFASV